jgi:starvation-inducible outer membrane lipoprotein
MYSVRQENKNKSGENIMRKVILLGILGVMLAVVAGCSSTPDKVKSTKYSKTVVKSQELIVE